MKENNLPNQWDEETSRQYLDYGRYFVPAREKQMEIMADLISGVPQTGTILELCCGEGLLAELILKEFGGMNYYGMDGSQVMLDKAGERLSKYPGRYALSQFDLVGSAWRKSNRIYSAVISSLAIHHLDGMGKQQLFLDLFPMLTAGGALIIADMVEPATPPGREVAAKAWDEVVMERSLQLDGNSRGLDFFLQEGWNTYRYVDLDDIDHPSKLFDQLNWLAQAGFVDIDVHFFQAGHAVFSGWKK